MIGSADAGDVVGGGVTGVAVAGQGADGVDDVVERDAQAAGLGDHRAEHVVEEAGPALGAQALPAPGETNMPRPRLL